MLTSALIWDTGMSRYTRHTSRKGVTSSWAGGHRKLHYEVLLYARGRTEKNCDVTAIIIKGDVIFGKGKTW